MVKFLESWGERMLRLVAPSTSAAAKVCGPWFYGRCQQGHCFLPWQDRLLYLRECVSDDGEYYWFEEKPGECGSCAA